MRLWDWLLLAVREEPAIATSQRAARGWIRRQSTILGGVDRALDLNASVSWDDEWTTWKRNIRVLLQLSSAERGERKISPLRNGEILDLVAGYLAKIRLILEDESPQDPCQDWPTTYAGIRPTMDDQMVSGIEYLDVFWQLIFASKFCPTLRFPVVCHSCGVNLPDKTPTGRSSKKAICARCSTGRRRNQLSIDDRRAENRKYQRERRRRLRSETR
jgi:hypothetical protein